MDPAVAIRKATRQDAELAASLIRASFRDVAERFSLNAENCPKHPSNCRAGWIESDLSRGLDYFILSRDGSPVGCVGLEARSGEPWHLERLAVLPEHRRRGHGRALVMHALSYAEKNGAPGVGIGIIAGHVELRKWYAGLGFVSGDTKSFPHLPFDVHFMEFRFE